MYVSYVLVFRKIDRQGAAPAPDLAAPAAGSGCGSARAAGAACSGPGCAAGDCAAADPPARGCLEAAQRVDDLAAGKVAPAGGLC